MFAGLHSYKYITWKILLISVLLTITQRFQKPNSMSEEKLNYQDWEGQTTDRHFLWSHSITTPTSQNYDPFTPAYLSS